MWYNLYMQMDTLERVINMKYEITNSCNEVMYKDIPVGKVFRISKGGACLKIKPNIYFRLVFNGTTSRYDPEHFHMCLNTGLIGSADPNEMAIVYPEGAVRITI